LVVEADEYNRHFLQFYPYIGAVTNIEEDHLDCYKDLADIQSAFEIFLSQSEYKVVDYKKYLDKVPKLSVPGLHNRMDAAVALAIADILNIKEEVVQRSLVNFSGTWRRLEKKGITKEGTIVYDDYAHHPTEIKASLEALRELYPKRDKKITVLFQPHLYSRTKAFFNEFVTSFDQADNIFILPIYFAREAIDESISSEKLAEAVHLHQGEAVAFEDFDKAETWLKDMIFGPNDVFVAMGAGEANKIIDKVFKLG
jgi:UDP-N-acetylmuramate--alanine ligase